MPRVKFKELSKEEKTTVSRFVERIQGKGSFTQISFSLMAELKERYEPLSPEKPELHTFSYEFPDGRYVELYFIDTDSLIAEQDKRAFATIM